MVEKVALGTTDPQRTPAFLASVHLKFCFPSVPSQSPVRYCTLVHTMVRVETSYVGSLAPTYRLGQSFDNLILN